MLRNGDKVVKSLGEQVYNYLCDQLKKRALNPGTFLDLNDIAAKLGISRTPLRDALIYLEVDGYVEIVPRRGVRVKYLELSEVKNLYQIIGSLEATAMVESSKQFTAEDYQQLNDMTREYRNKVEVGNLDDCLSINYAFHDYFLDRCGNPFLARMVRTLKRRLYDWPRHTDLLADWERINLAEHERMVSLLEAGDAQAAAAVLRDVHWQFQTQEDYIRSFYAGSSSPESEQEDLG